MSPCAAAIALAINALPGAASEHVPVTARAIELAAPTPRRAALLVAIGYHESRFLPRIQAGDCRTYTRRGQKIQECDAGRARSYFQMQHTALAPEWPELLGLDAPTVKLAARVADRILARGLRSCKTEAGAASYYATGRCTWPGGVRRGAMAKRILPKLEACTKG